MIPNIGQVGQFGVAKPWVIDIDDTYRCEALRSLNDIYAMNIDPYTRYYAPMGILRATYDTMDLSGVLLCTLISTKTGEVKYIPTSHITKLPDFNTVLYKHYIIGIDVGLLPDETSFDQFKADVGTLCRRSLGSVGTAVVSIAPTEGVVTTTEHERLQAYRESVKLKGLATPTTLEENVAMAEMSSRISEIEGWLSEVQDILFDDDGKDSSGDVVDLSDYLNSLKSAILKL